MASISPRRNKNGNITSYTIRVSRGYDADGKRIAPYRLSFRPDKGLTEKQARKQAEKAAEEFEKQCKCAVSMGGYTKLSEFCPTFLEAAENTYAPRTVENYGKIINLYIDPMLGNLRLNEIDAVHVQDFVNEMGRSKKHKSNGEATDENISSSTVKNRLSVLQSVLTFAVKLNCISENPAISDNLILPGRDGREIRIFSDQEITEMLREARTEPLWFRTLLNLAIYTGMRKGELIALKYEDIDFGKPAINISRSAYKVIGKQQSTKLPKNGRERTVAVNTGCVELLEQLMNESGGDYVFHDKDGSMLPAIKINRCFSKFLDKCGIPRRKFHTLRHTSATLLLYSGTDIKTVQNRLGHADIATTNKYLHLVDNSDKNAVDRLEDFLTKN